MTMDPGPTAEEKALLAARARRLAAVEVPTDTVATGQVIGFSVADERYGFEAHEVDDVQPLHDLTPLPGVPAFWRGLVNLRGRVVPVIDLRRFFGLPEHGITDLHCILLLRHAELELGLLVDTVDGVTGEDLAALQPPLPGSGGIDAGYVRGITRDRRVILEARAILSDPRIVIDDDLS